MYFPILPIIPRVLEYESGTNTTSSNPFNTHTSKQFFTPYRIGLLALAIIIFLFILASVLYLIYRYKSRNRKEAGPQAKKNERRNGAAVKSKDTQRNTAAEVYALKPWKVTEYVKWTRDRDDEDLRAERTRVRGAKLEGLNEGMVLKAVEVVDSFGRVERNFVWV